MKIGRFYTPTVGKVLVTISLALINLGMAFYAAQGILCTYGCQPPTFLQEISAPSLYPFLVIKLFGEFFEEFSLYLPEWSLFILGAVPSFLFLLLFWYTISCLLTKIFSMMRNK